ncbi:TetR/AcrR family transcriptional regulator C-terminal domain-containing protein [Leucobacter sp. CSA2]|uniref:TetR/AcrR family transcriptional regulator C-terminal domain-containing protein n=1 Tax=Leucobacter edaphi TaxID=2796472 RepID=A0A934QCJ8_9MICO|nr:TetR/AcrR family transcriptional regulator [Leucobacter edaphi]MBK0422145.1 TetR/AcrR family transcriptional regulator C-terminal domain-containing protein [Leucobacter edaphi]
MAEPGPTPGKRAAGRPKRAVLSRESILAGAFALAEERGADFTLAALARRLGVQPSALHHYFHGRADLIAGMRGELALRVGDHGFDRLPWHEAIIPWAIAYRDTFGTHPGLIAALATLPIESEPESMVDYERVAAAFARDGYPEHLIVPALVAVESFVIGSALDALTPDDNLRPSGAEAEANAPTLASAERSAREAAVARGRSVATETFEFGLTALVAGLRAAGETR